jgi:hypothetical protein
MQHCAWLKSITQKKTHTDSTQYEVKKNVVSVIPCLVHTAKIHSNILCNSEVKYAQNYDNLNPMDKFMMNEGFNRGDMPGKTEIDILVENPNTLPIKAEYMKWQAVFENKLLDSGTVNIQSKINPQESYWVRIKLQYNAMQLTTKNTMLTKTNTALQLNTFKHLQIFTQIESYPVYDANTVIVQGNCKDTIMKMLILK